MKSAVVEQREKSQVDVPGRATTTQGEGVNFRLGVLPKSQRLKYQGEPTRTAGVGAIVRMNPMMDGRRPGR